MTALMCPHCGSADVDPGRTGLDMCNDCGGLSRAGMEQRKAHDLGIGPADMSSLRHLVEGVAERVNGTTVVWEMTGPDSRRVLLAVDRDDDEPDGAPAFVWARWAADGSLEGMGATPAEDADKIGISTTEDYEAAGWELSNGPRQVVRPSGLVSPEWLERSAAAAWGGV